MNKSKACLYLFPSQLGETALSRILPDFNIHLIAEIRYFIVEDLRTARRFLKKNNSQINIDALEFFVLNKQTKPEELNDFIQPLLQGHSMGIISEAGCPAIADPGATIVALAHQHSIQVVPLIGPSSILLALMASGFNGQSFAFNGYLPIPKAEKATAIHQAEKRIFNENQTQIYIETPYRNMQTLADLIEYCRPHTQLCIAADISLSTEFIQTKSMADWKLKLPDLNKRPTVFILYK